MEKFLVTIRVSKKAYRSRKELYEIYSDMRKSLKGYEWSSLYAYELDSKRRWHFHTIVKGPRKPYIKRFNKNGMYVHFQERLEPLDHPSRDIVQYVSKDPQDPDNLGMLDWQSRAQYEYLFV